MISFGSIIESFKLRHFKERLLMMASIFDNTFTFILFVILLINTATSNCRCILFLGASSLSSNLCIKEPVLPWLPILFDAMDFLIYFIIR